MPQKIEDEVNGMNNRKEKARKVMENAMVEACNQHRDDQLFEDYNAVWDYEGWSVIVNSGHLLSEGWDPNYHEDLSNMVNGFTDKPEAVKLVVLYHPNLPRQSLIDGLRCIVNYINENGIYIKKYLTREERLRDVREREEINRAGQAGEVPSGE